MIIFKLLLIAHFIGDFVLQPKKLVESKKNNINRLVTHTIVYTLLITLVLLFFGSLGEILFWSGITFFSHFLIDYLRIKITTKYKNNITSFYAFIIDQILHVILLLIISSIIKINLNLIGNYFYNIDFFKNISFPTIINYCLAFSIVLKPTEVFIKHLFNFLFNKTDLCEDNKPDNIGALIGKLERVLILLLGLLGLYSSIALVLTAKSLARFKQLNDQKFAEKYLVGTLISLIIAILSLLIIK